MKPHVLLSVAYLPPIEYFVLLSGGNASIEKCEYYRKQSYRNRTLLLTANGINQLSIPICHQQHKMLIEEVKIDYQMPWQRNHWKTIESAYNNSPFFLYYQDYIKPFYQKQYPYLFDFNIELINTLLNLLKLDITCQFTSEYQENVPNTIDARHTIHPKNAFSQNYPFSIENSYSQVFDNKFGFFPNLSIIDLLFNRGTDSSSFIQKNDPFAQK